MDLIPPYYRKNDSWYSRQYDNDAMEFVEKIDDNAPEKAKRSFEQYHEIMDYYAKNGAVPESMFQGYLTIFDD